MLHDEQLEDIAAWGRSGPSANDPTAPAEFEPNLDRVRAHIASRRALPPQLPADDGELHRARPLEDHRDHVQSPGEHRSEYLELWNTTGKSIDVSGWTIEGLEPAEARFTFPAGSDLVTDEIIIVAKDPITFTSRHGDVARVFGPFEGNLDDDGEALRLRDDGPDYPATVDYLRYGKRDGWPPEADGHGYSLELTDVRPDRDNDIGLNWRASLGGTPGFVEGISPGQVFFRRGDANSIGSLDVGDVVFILLHLFSGGTTPSCLKSADADDSGVLDVSDPLYLLDYLFKAGPAPPAPYLGLRCRCHGRWLSCEAFAPCI